MFSTVDKAGSEHIAVRSESMIDKVGIKQAKSHGPHGVIGMSSEVQMEVMQRERIEMKTKK